jgi:hypothetical protein
VNGIGHQERANDGGSLSRLFRLPLFVATVGMSLALCGSAQAATVTVGSPLEATFGGTLGSLGSAPTGTWANTVLPEPGANVTSPVSGVIVRWHMAGNYSAGRPFELRVLEPASSGQYKGVGTSSPVTPTGGMQTFTAGLPIKAGDLIGLDVDNGYIGAAGVSGSHVVDWFPSLAEGSTLAPPYLSNDTELGFNAEVQPPPGVTSVSPASGSLSGGTSVMIAGHDFTGATAVAFGNTPASSFTVNSDTQITATSPPASALGVIFIIVTTPAGQNSVESTNGFTYKGCLVPPLKRQNLKLDRKRLNKAGCALGKVKGKKSRSAKVIKQSPKPGKVLAPGSKVSVKLGG